MLIFTCMPSTTLVFNTNALACRTPRHNVHPRCSPSTCMQDAHLHEEHPETLDDLTATERARTPMHRLACLRCHFLTRKRCCRSCSRWNSSRDSCRRPLSGCQMTTRVLPGQRREIWSSSMARRLPLSVYEGSTLRSMFKVSFFPSKA